MSKPVSQRANEYRPGVWSTDNYIRAWAMKQCQGKEECLVPLQSLQDAWVARVRFDKPGKPVERFIAHNQSA